MMANDRVLVSPLSYGLMVKSRDQERKKKDNGNSLRARQYSVSRLRGHATPLEQRRQSVVSDKYSTGACFMGCARARPYRLGYARLSSAGFARSRLSETTGRLSPAC